MDNERVLSGMRPTGRLHLGHYHGVLKNWLELQSSYDCYFFIADWHALTTEYENPSPIDENIWEMAVDWLAAGIDPGSAKLFVQSWVPEHAELHLLLSMFTPLSWLERVPSYKDQQQKLVGKDLGTYGFLGYPLLQTADIILYKANWVPVGEDQVAHVELAREVARRFNHLYGRESGFEDKVRDALRKMGKKSLNLYEKGRKLWQQDGDSDALVQAKEVLNSQKNMTLRERERLFGYLEGSGRMIFPEPQSMLTEVTKLTGLDGGKMSKSAHNTIHLRGDPKETRKQLKSMPTDPARVRRNDPGNPEKCPVWNLHSVYSDETLRESIHKGCTQAKIGCVQCKEYVADAVVAEQEIIGQRAQEYLQDPDTVRDIINEGSKAARETARETMEEVRQAMHLSG
ncbi:MAG: tryptophan--tRNA ligase [Candidatus Eutrophobiaceae bacterium]